MNAPKIAGLLTVLAFAGPVESLAQDPTLIKSGDRVRITASTVSRTPMEGRVLRISSDTLTLAPSTYGGIYRVVPVSSLERLRISRRVKAYTGVGASLGLLAGGVAGYLAGNSFLDEHPWNCTSVSVPDTEIQGLEHSHQVCTRTSGQKGTGQAIAFTVLGAAGGAALGALIGSAIKTDLWEEIPLDELRIEPSSIASDGVSVSVSVHM